MGTHIIHKRIMPAEALYMRGSRFRTMEEAEEVRKQLMKDLDRLLGK